MVDWIRSEARRVDSMLETTMSQAGRPSQADAAPDPRLASLSSKARKVLSHAQGACQWSKKLA